jgi:hypothetical protein
MWAACRRTSDLTSWRHFGGCSRTRCERSRPSSGCRTGASGASRSPAPWRGEASAYCALLKHSPSGSGVKRRFCGKAVDGTASRSQAPVAVQPVDDQLTSIGLRVEGFARPGAAERLALALFVQRDPGERGQLTRTVHLDADRGAALSRGRRSPAQQAPSLLVLVPSPLRLHHALPRWSLGEHPELFEWQG